MKRAPILLALSLAAATLALAGCGGGSEDVPASAIAVVDGTEIARSELDELLDQAKATYKDNFPKVGTPEYQGLQQQLVAALVQKAQFEREASERGIVVSDADVEKARDDVLESRFGGDEKKLEAALEEQNLTDEMLRKTLRYAVLSQKLSEAVTKDVKVTDQEALVYYTQNQDQYGTPESRSVRHILIREQVDPSCVPSAPTDPTPKQCDIDFAKSKALADRVYGELQGGADFAALVQEYSDDEGTKKDGGKYEAVRGQSVPEFDEAAFDLDTNEISRPVRTQFGYHLIEPLADIVPAKTTPLDKVKAAIKTSLLSQKRSEFITQWVQDLQKSYEGKISYAAGLAPPEIPEDEPTETQ